MTDKGITSCKIDEYLKIKEEYEKRSYNLVELNGQLIKNKKELLLVFSKALKFPAYFGMNLDALEECLCDLDSWLENTDCAILIKNRNLFFDNSYYNAIEDILVNVKKFWHKKSVDFEIIIFK